VSTPLLLDNAHQLTPSLDYTAQDALRRIIEESKLPTHAMIMETCAMRLTSSGICDVVPEVFDGTAYVCLPLLKYSHTLWHLHVKRYLIGSADQIPQASSMRHLPHFLGTCKSFPLSLGLPCPDSLEFASSPLHLIAYHGLPMSIPCACLEATKRTNLGKTALHFAVERDDAILTQRLLELEGIDVNAANYVGRTALMDAAHRRHSSVFEALLRDPRVDPSYEGCWGHTVLHCIIDGACEWVSHPEEAKTCTMLDQVLALPSIDVNKASHYGTTPLMLAIYARRYPSIFTRLSQVPNIDPNRVDEGGKTALMHACLFSTSAIVQACLELSGNARVVDCFGATALMYRARPFPFTPDLPDFLSDFKALKAAGVDVNEKDRQGCTALFYAAGGLEPEPLIALLQLPDVDINARDCLGRTALMAVTSPEVFYHLIRAPGVDVNARADDGSTALICAAASKQHAPVRETPFPSPLVQLLQHPDISPSLTSRDCGTALLGSLMTGAASTLQALADEKLEAPWTVTHHCDSRLEIHQFDNPPDRIVLERGEREGSPARTWVLTAVPQISFCLHNATDYYPYPQGLRNLYPARPYNLPILSTGRLKDVGATSHAPVERITMEHVSKTLVLLENLDPILAFPWETSWIAEGLDDRLQELLNHPGIDDWGLGYLRRPVARDVTSTAP
jgi:ankyrin repeat protein